MTTTEKLWTCSADSHFREPDEIYQEKLPKDVRDLLPRAERISDEEELVHMEGRSFTRRIPKPSSPEMARAREEIMKRMAQGGAGEWDGRERLERLDEQGVWGEVVFPSGGLWYGQLENPELVAAGARVLNDHLKEQLIDVSPRFIPAATLPLQSIDLAVAEVHRVHELGYKAVFLPTSLGDRFPRWNEDAWEPLWAVVEDLGLVAAFHIGTDAGGVFPYKNPGGALLNYVETTYGGQKAVSMLVASGALERHPDLRVLVSEGGATWVPFIGDRLNEAYRQHDMYMDGRLTKAPKQYLMEQVYATFQHDETAVPTVDHLGYRNVAFGGDFFHAEGTYPHTQKVLRELFANTSEETSERIRNGSFLELFPSVGAPPS